MSTGSDPNNERAPLRARRGPPTGVFMRFSDLVLKAEQVARRQSAVPPDRDESSARSDAPPGRNQ